MSRKLLVSAVIVGVIIVAQLDRTSFDSSERAFTPSPDDSPSTSGLDVPAASPPVASRWSSPSQDLPTSHFGEGGDRLKQLQTEWDADAVRRAARDLEHSASRFSDGVTDWRRVISDVQTDLDSTRRRARDLEWSLGRAGNDPYLDMDLSRLNRNLRDIEFELDRARVGERWPTVVPNIQTEAHEALRAARSLTLSPYP